MKDIQGQQLLSRLPDWLEEPHCGATLFLQPLSFTKCPIPHLRGCILLFAVSNGVLFLIYSKRTLERNSNKSLLQCPRFAQFRARYRKKLDGPQLDIIKVRLYKLKGSTRCLYNVVAYGGDLNILVV